MLIAKLHVCYMFRLCISHRQAPILKILKTKMRISYYIILHCIILYYIMTLYFITHHRRTMDCCIKHGDKRGCFYLREDPRDLLLRL
jgi:hypothetical protein